MGVYYSLGCDKCKEYVDVEKMWDNIETGIIIMGFIYDHCGRSCSNNIGLMNQDHMEDRDCWTNVEDKALEYMKDSAMQESKNYLDSLFSEQATLNYAYNLVFKDLEERIENISYYSNKDIKEYKDLYEDLKCGQNVSTKSYDLPHTSVTFKMYEEVLNDIAKNMSTIEMEAREKLTPLKNSRRHIEAIMHKMAKDIFKN